MSDTMKTEKLSVNGSEDVAGAPKGPNEKLDDQKSATIYLAETFYITTKKNSQFEVKLSDRGICLRKESNGTAKEQVIFLKDVIGCRCLRSKRKGQMGSPCACSSMPGPAQLKVVDEHSTDLDETDVSAYLYIYAYILKKVGRRGKSSRRERTTLTLRFRSFDSYEDNNREAQKWRTTIKRLIQGEDITVSPKLIDNRRVLVLLNPKSGSGKSREIFQQRVAPIFAEAEVAFDLHVTKRAFWAREFVRVKDIYMWRGIVVVGGDGIFWEVINGILERSDWQLALDQLSIGIIPCGSGNGLAKTIAHVYGFAMLLKVASCLIGIQLLLSGAIAQNNCCSSSSSATNSCPSQDGDPHYFQVCSNGQSYTYQCPNLTLYVAEQSYCDNNLYNSCSNDMNGCVPYQQFPWNGFKGSLEPPPCTSAQNGGLSSGIPFGDPSFYWHCNSIYGVAELRECPPGMGYILGDVIGCVGWYQWND